jgi:ribosomal protein L35AE/L33A
VLTQVTGPPELETAAEPSAPQGMPIAGRVSRTFGPNGVVVVGFAAVVCGTVL